MSLSNFITLATNIEVQLIQFSKDIPPNEKNALLKEFDDVCNDVFELDPHFFQKQNKFFDKDFGVVLVRDNTLLVGFSIYQRITLKNRKKILYRYVTVIKEQYQGRRIYRSITKLILESEFHFQSGHKHFWAWRTRNPQVLASLSKYCRRVYPSLTENAEFEDLKEMGILAAKELYPEISIEVPSMVMRNAYDYFKYRNRPHHHDHSIDGLFHKNHELGENDAIFFVGELIPSTH